MRRYMLVWQACPFAKRGRVWGNSITRVVQDALNSVGQSDYSIQKDNITMSDVKPAEHRV